MPLGWIDFSKKDRNKVLSVLNLLSEAGTLDELGIAPVRDGFANLFFPGTSTIQTRAKYFLIVPYALKDLELSKETNPNRFLKTFDEIERICAERLIENSKGADGIIGSRSLAEHQWVKQTPASIYWAGLRNYGIFIGGNMSLTEYARAICAMKNRKASLKSLGNRNDSNPEKESDDNDAGDFFKMQFWKLPTYTQGWMDDLNIDLTAEEGDYLKRQIVTSFPDSMLAFVLKNNLSEILECRDFQEIHNLINIFPEKIQNDYVLAYEFSEFLFILRIVYNMIVSGGENSEANERWSGLQPELADIAAIDLERIIDRLQIRSNVRLCSFLGKTKTMMMEDDLEGLKIEIKRRERELKQSRSKTLHPGEFDPNSWFSGRKLDYRFGDAKVIIRDIFESEGLHVKS